MVYSALPSFITEKMCFNQFLSERSPDMYISNGGIMSSSVWGKLEKQSSIRTFTQSESFAAIRRRSFAAATRQSSDPKYNKKLRHSSDTVTDNSSKRFLWSNNDWSLSFLYFCIVSSLALVSFNCVLTLLTVDVYKYFQIKRLNCFNRKMFYFVLY